MIQEARTRGERDYTIVYTRLPKGRLDVNTSRDSLGLRTVTFSVDRLGVETCTATIPFAPSFHGGNPCPKAELPLLPAPGLWPTKFLQFYPVPLLPASAGPSAEMPCVDP